MPDGGEITRLRFRSVRNDMWGGGDGDGTRSGGDGILHGGMVAGEGDFSQWEEGSGGRRGEGDDMWRGIPNRRE